MTQQVKEAYRKNRRATFFVVLAVIVAAAVAIPLAIGAPDKPYTLSVSGTTPAWKSNAAGPPQIVTLCAGESYTLELTLTDEAKSQSLGSADVDFPGVVSVDANSVEWSGGNYAATATKENDLVPGASRVSLRFLDLPKNGGFVKFTVTLTASATPGGPAPFDATVKQANDFNDGGDANIFNPAQALPQLKVETCAGTISGAIWNDQNEDKIKDSFEDAQIGEDLPGGSSPWTVKLYQRTAAGTYTEFTGAPLTTSANGAYQFANVPLNKYYVVCVTQPAGDTGTWTQSTPTTPVTKCAGTGGEPNGWGNDAGGNASGLAPFTTSQIGKDFGNVNTISVSCDAPSEDSVLEFNTESETSKYTVWIPEQAVCDKTEGDPAEFVFEAYELDNLTRVANLHNTDSGAGPVTVVERMEWKFTGTDQPDPANRSLKYDDTPPYGDVLEDMQYCLIDPLPNGIAPALLLAWGIPRAYSRAAPRDVVPDRDRGACWH